LGRDQLNPPRGVRDIVGEEAELYEYLFGEFRRIAQLNGFKPVIPPTIEYYQLFEAKSGEEIKRSMYVFEDKGGRLLALRPEVTASVVRIYLRKLRGEVKPIRLYYVAQCFRYEEPQHARYREFWQAGLEVFGEPDVNGDLAAAVTASMYLDVVGVKHHYIVGNVAFHRMLMANAGLSIEAQDHVLHLIDKSLIDEALSYLEQNVSSTYVEAFNKLINTPLDGLDAYADEFKDLLSDKLEKFLEEKNRVLSFIETLEQLGYQAAYDPRLVRGLAYYTGLIYEYKSDKLNVSIGGGGRYDNLTEVYGGPPEYSTGLALGIDRIALTLMGSREFKKTQVGEVAIIALDKIPLSYPYEILKILVTHNLPAWVLRVSKISKGLSVASRKNAEIAIIIGEKEYGEGSVAIKDLLRGTQTTAKPNSVIEVIEEMLKAHRQHSIP